MDRSFVAVGATVAAVVATMTIPPLFSTSAQAGPSVPGPTGPTLEPPGSTTWQSVRCGSTGAKSCVVPSTIDHGGALFYTIGGRRQYVVPGSTGTYRLSMMVPASGRDRWVLVGAEGAGS